MNTTASPREKMDQFGPSLLSDAELLAIILGTGSRNMPVLELAKQLLQHFGSLKHVLTASREDFSSIPGIGLAKYAQLRAAWELCRRQFAQKIRPNTILKDSQHTKDYFRAELSHLSNEVFCVLFLNARNQVIRFEQLFQGSINHTNVHARIIAQKALQYNAAAIILAHNHPSGDPTPSIADRSLTHYLREVLSLLDIRVHDHIVVGAESAFSMADHGWLR